MSWEQRLDALRSPESRESMKRLENFVGRVQPYLIRFGIQRGLAAAGVGMPSYASGDFLHGILYLEEQQKAAGIFFLLVDLFVAAASCRLTMLILRPDCITVALSGGLS